MAEVLKASAEREENGAPPQATSCPALFERWIGGCSAAEIGAKRAAIAAVRTKLRDPSSAEFSAVEYVDRGKFVCGLVNGANAFGAKAGNQLFFVQGDDVLLGSDAVDPIVAKSKLNPTICGDPIRAAERQD